MSVNTETVEFIGFAKKLFSHPSPPPENSMFIEVHHEDDASYNDFLYDLFCYGVRYKYGLNEKGELKEHTLSRDNFEFIRGYFRAIGVDVILLDFSAEEKRIKVAFQPWYKC